MNLLDLLRKEYQTRGLDRRELEADPFRQFDQWFRRAVETRPGEWLEPNAMTLATSADDRVTARTVLLKDYDDRQLTFFTNYQSEKGRQLAANARAALLFHWAWLGRQVRIEGVVTKSTREISEAYFRARPRGARLSALASAQSSLLESREAFEQVCDALERQFEGAEIPLPEFWGGYHLTPSRWEFWQGREDRSHDRFRYSPDEGAPAWRIERLAP